MSVNQYNTYGNKKTIIFNWGAAFTIATGVATLALGVAIYNGAKKPISDTTMSQVVLTIGTGVFEIIAGVCWLIGV